MKETGKNPRETALLILEQIFLKGAYANLALAQGLRRASLSLLDRKLATELVYGTVKTLGTLDWYLAKVVNRPLRKLDPLVLVILRLGAYQLLYLDRIPVSAACNESVELAKKWVHERCPAAAGSDQRPVEIPSGTGKGIGTDRPGILPPKMASTAVEIPLRVG